MLPLVLPAKSSISLLVLVVEFAMKLRVFPWRQSFLVRCSVFGVQLIMNGPVLSIEPFMFLIVWTAPVVIVCRSRDGKSNQRRRTYHRQYHFTHLNLLIDDIEICALS
jgi:hypothetical protein